MYKNATYKEKFAALREWIPSIIETVKKDLKNEHLKKDFSFVKKFLATKNLNKVTTEDLAHAYQKAIEEEERGEEIAEFIASRWLLKNSELYAFFEQQLSQMYPDFTALEELKPEEAKQLIESASNEFGPPQTYLFAVLNSVVFPDESFKTLKSQAQQHQEKQQQESHELAERLTVETMQKGFEREIARLTDKYEKKLSGLQKKYVQDTESLKKLLSQLQRKLHDKSS